MITIHQIVIHKDIPGGWKRYVVDVRLVDPEQGTHISKVTGLESANYDKVFRTQSQYLGVALRNVGNELAKILVV